GLASRIVFYVIYRLIRSIILLESAIYAWFVDKAKPVEIFHVVGRFRPVVSEVATLDDFIVFHEAFASAQELFAAKEWYLYGFDGRFAWFVKCSATLERHSMTRELFENAAKVARLSIRDFLKEHGEIPGNPVSITTLTSLDGRGTDAVLSRLHLDDVHVEADPPYLASLSFPLSKSSGRNRRLLLESSLRFALRFVSAEKALVTIRSALIDTVPLFSRIDLPCASFILQPRSAGEAIERILETDRDYLLVITRLLPLLPAWSLLLLTPTLAAHGDHFLRIAPGRADEAALAVYCRFLQESSRLSLSAFSLIESALQVDAQPLADALGVKTKNGDESRELAPATTISRSRLRALKRLAFASIEEDLPWEESSPSTNL
ncbi:hypothetical protein PENTCL1PPCAC_77, partial [Pristionchus entomophagus]